MTISTSILTFTGAYLNMDDTDGATFKIVDVAHALSQICRFGGHTRNFYSVAQHSVLVSHIVPPEFQLQALLHDGAEAYCGDVVQPIKILHWMDGYRSFESDLQNRLLKHFGVERTPESDAAVRRADLQMLATERRDLMAPDSRPWPVLAGVAPRQATISPKMPTFAEAMFLQRYKELTGVL